MSTETHLSDELYADPNAGGETKADETKADETKLTKRKLTKRKLTKRKLTMLKRKKMTLRIKR